MLGVEIWIGIHLHSSRVEHLRVIGPGRIAAPHAGSWQHLVDEISSQTDRGCSTGCLNGDRSTTGVHLVIHTKKQLTYQLRILWQAVDLKVGFRRLGFQKSFLGFFDTIQYGSVAVIVFIHTDAQINFFPDSGRF